MEKGNTIVGIIFLSHVIQFMLFTPRRTGVGNLRPAWIFDMARIRIFITKLELKISSKRSSMISKYLKSIE